MNPYQTPGEVIPDGPAPLPKGPAKKCKGCGYAWIITFDSYGHEKGREPALVIPRACTPYTRIGFLWWKCSTPGEHLHERCRHCGLEWLTAFAEGT